ncbi:hypothetical protein CTI12_AA609660 [Artemisia annua]|uniref:Uncharacterized protein n=1 Tax=Artemisia annua TaxID=35608 RepID=A0A2U1KF76_ARTAN|nr:hypothetical protein CTI12_AA609660 [Artemisia annua]
MVEAGGVGNIIQKGKESEMSWETMLYYAKNVKGANITYRFKKVGSLLGFMWNVTRHHKELQGEALVLFGETKLELERGLCEKLLRLLAHLYNIASMHLCEDLEEHFPNPLWCD